MFQFKQFAVDQTGCAMKINTDGVLLGALASSKEPKAILDIGTGTGVIALMLAQRFSSSHIDAVEIDEQAAETANRNFQASPYNSRLTAYAQSFTGFFEQFYEKRYDLIVSNPPFYINSLKSPGVTRAAAKHADAYFFKQLISLSAQHLTMEGLLCLILPIETAEVVTDAAIKNGLHLQKKIEVKSYPDSESHREIVVFSRTITELQSGEFVIYDSPKQYTEQYREVLRDFFTIF